MSKRIIRIYSWLSIDVSHCRWRGRNLQNQLASRTSTSRWDLLDTLHNMQFLIIFLELTSVSIAGPGNLVTPTMGYIPRELRISCSSIAICIHQQGEHSIRILWTYPCSQQWGLVYGSRGITPFFTSSGPRLNDHEWIAHRIFVDILEIERVYTVDLVSQVS